MADATSTGHILAPSETKTEKPTLSERLRSEEWIGRILVLLSAVLLLSIWHVWAGTTTPLVLPAPLDVFERLVTYVGEGLAWPHVTITLQEIGLGFALGSFVGISVGVLASEFGIFRRVIMPYVIITQALPKFALAPILVFWFGFGMAPKVIIAALISFFPLLENTFLGLTSTPKDMVELFRALQANRWTTLIKGRLPHAIPTIFSGLRVAVMLSLVGAVVAEYVGANKGLGALIIASNGTLDRELMFVAFVLLTVVGFSLDKLHGLVYRLVMRRLYGSSAPAMMGDQSKVSV